MHDDLTGPSGRTAAAPVDGGRAPLGGARTTRRRGRMSAAKHRALRELTGTWALPHGAATTPAALVAAFGRDVPRLLDIGVGTGEATRARAIAEPAVDVVAVELHRPGIARLLGALEASGPPNVRVVETDVTALLEDAAPGCFDEVRVLFPDPWPKRRHWARRLVDATFVRRVGDLLPVGGVLHVATDWAPYAEQVRDVLDADPRFQAVTTGVDAPGGWTSARPDRPVTTYEARGLAAGRTVVDLVARRT